MIYRITTEQVNGETTDIVADLALKRGFEGFNISLSYGHYKGKKERALTIEIDTLSRDNKTYEIFHLAEDIKIALNQECVLVQSIESRSFLNFS